MAQAARLSLRMQKEVKLLLTDPPHGSTLPHLSPDSEPSSSSSSMSTIHAQIKGPEGTVYAKGVFEIKIQIPERYPFQPPGVTFVTPIYHPNIDNGGRICLDILNLPPKGAWQPSLNIWTVITSIRLLLSEPNPDDGLMCEASKEYKYNRQAFDQKAISMTEKFAKAGAGGSCLSVDTNPSPSMMEVKKAAEPKLFGVDEHIVDQKKFSGNRRKLSLESSVSSQKRSDELDVNKVHSPPYFANSRNPTEAEGIIVQGSKGTPLDYSSSHDNPNGTKRRLSLESFSQEQKIDCINPDRAVQNHCLLQATSCHEKRLDEDGELVRGEKSTSSEQLCPVTQKQLSGSTQESKGSLSVPRAVDPRTGFIDRMENVSTNINCNKPCLAGKKLSLHTKGSSKKTAKEDKENMVPARKLSIFNIHSPSSKPCVDHKLSVDAMIHEKLQRNQDTNGSIEQQVTVEPALPETVIVLDSEDSEEETNTPPARTKLPLARRLGKWRAKA